MRAIAGGKSPCDAVSKPWVEFLNTRRKKDVIQLEGTVHLIINIKQGGLVHCVSEKTRNLSREQRRSHCGWRVGGAVANVRFTKTSFWPPACKSNLLCSRCFASSGASPTTEGVYTSEASDRIEG